MTKKLDWELAANLTIFLVAKTGSPRGFWGGHLKKADQLKLFGQYFGKARIRIHGEKELVWTVRSSGFGMDREIENVTTFSELIGLSHENPNEAQDRLNMPWSTTKMVKG